MSSDIMRYVGGAVPSERRVPQSNLLMTRMGIGTTAISISCEWSGYDLLIVCAMFYGNVMASVVVPGDYFAGTTSGGRVTVTDPANNRRFEVWKNGDDAVYAKIVSSPDSAFGVRIYGVLFGE